MLDARRRAMRRVGRLRRHVLHGFDTQPHFHQRRQVRQAVSALRVDCSHDSVRAFGFIKKIPQNLAGSSHDNNRQSYKVS